MSKLTDKILHPGKSSSQAPAKSSVPAPVGGKDKHPKKAHREADYAEHPKFAKFKQGAK